MKIIITTPTFPPDTGGVAEVVHKQYKYLKKHGHDVVVITAGKQVYDSSYELNVDIIRLNMKYGGFPKYAAGDLFGIRDGEKENKYINLLMNLEADIVINHCWQAWNTDWAFKNYKKINKPMAIFSHGTSINTINGLFGYIKYLRWRIYSISNINKYLKISSLFFVLEDYLDNDRFYDIKRAKELEVPYIVIPNGCNENLVNIDYKKKKKLILCVAQYSNEKNPLQLVKAFAKIKNYDWRVIICGSDKNRYYSKVMNVVRHLKLEKNIECYVGLSRREIELLYESAAIVVSTSRTECQPLVLLDAMGAGAPFIAMKTGCIEKFSGGIIASNKDELTRGLYELMSDEFLRKSLGEKGKKEAKEKYNWDNSLRILENALEYFLRKKCKN